MFYSRHTHIKKQLLEFALEKKEASDDEYLIDLPHAAGTERDVGLQAALDAAEAVLGCGRKPIAVMDVGGAKCLTQRCKHAYPRIELCGLACCRALRAPEDERGDKVRRPADGHEPLVRVHLVQSFKSLEGPLEFSDASVITEEKRSSNHSGAFFFAS